MSTLGLYQNPIFLDYTGYTALSDIQTAVNTTISDNPGYCLAGWLDSVGYGSGAGWGIFVFDEDWSVPHPIHSVILVERDEGTPAADWATVHADNPGYYYVTTAFFPGIPVSAFVLGAS